LGLRLLPLVGFGTACLVVERPSAMANYITIMTVSYVVITIGLWAFNRWKSDPVR
jgi:hypothetical protein